MMRLDGLVIPLDIVFLLPIAGGAIKPGRPELELSVDCEPFGLGQDVIFCLDPELELGPIEMVSILGTLPLDTILFWLQVDGSPGTIGPEFMKGWGAMPRG